MSNLTGWFPASVKPVRNGVYKVFTPRNAANCYAYWDKKGWRLCGGSVEQAIGEQLHTLYITSSSMLVSASKWRGLASDPSKGKK